MSPGVCCAGAATTRAIGVRVGQRMIQKTSGFMKWFGKADSCSRNFVDVGSTLHMVSGLDVRFLERCPMKTNPEG
eukprot:300253-Amorphochlora_amoeboformis.AAC.1